MQPMNKGQRLKDMWLNFLEPGDRRLSTSPFARVPCWAPIFQLHPYGPLATKRVAMQFA